MVYAPLILVSHDVFSARSAGTGLVDLSAAPLVLAVDPTLEMDGGEIIAALVSSSEASDHVGVAGASGAADFSFFWAVALRRSQAVSNPSL